MELAERRYSIAGLVQDEPPVVQVRDLRVSLIGKHTNVSVIRGIDLDIRRGASLGLVGESGAGKSVTALSLMRLLSPSFTISGSIRLGDIEITSLSERDMHALRGRELFMVLQDASTSLNPSMTVRQQLNEVISRRRPNGAESRDDPTRLMVDALLEVGIIEPERWLRRFPHELSGGMRQRVVIAMGMLAAPRLLIADEPTSALDVVTQRSVLAVLRHLQRRHQLALLFVTHDLRAVARICDEVAVMYAGHVVERGPVQSIITAPRHPYTLGLLRSIPSLHERNDSLFQLGGDPPSLFENRPGCPFAPRCERAIERCQDEFPSRQIGPRGASFFCWNPVPEGTLSVTGEGGHVNTD